MSGLIAKPSAPKQMLDGSWPSEVTHVRIVRAARHQVFGDVDHDVDADDIIQPEAAAARPTDEWPRNRINLFHAKVQSFRDMDGLEHAPHSVAVRDEAGSVLCEHDAP